MGNAASVRRYSWIIESLKEIYIIYYERKIKYHFNILQQYFLFYLNKKQKKVNKKNFFIFFDQQNVI